MGKGTKASVSYFNGADKGTVGKAQKGGKSGDGGSKPAQINAGASPPSAAQPKGEAAKGTENLKADAKSLHMQRSGPGEFHTDSRPKLSKFRDKP